MKTLLKTYFDDVVSGCMTAWRNLVKRKPMVFTWSMHHHFKLVSPQVRCIKKVYCGIHYIGTC